ncbi:MAG: 2OG-Fe(II) oxygenase [Campylobacterales bacterium]|nr:2OG-Fe(II) oxygenase [Campylobacterales bacterium]
MIQISNEVFCDERLQVWDIENRILPNPYYDKPFLVIPNFLDEPLAHEISQSIYESSHAKKAQIKSMLLQSVVDASVDESIRKTNIYTLNELHTTIYHNLFRLHQPQMERFFNLSLTLSTPIQALEYTQGSFYIKHADDSNELIDKEGQTVGFNCVAPQRKLTTVLFATSYQDEAPKDEDTSHFSGGELLFNYLFDQQDNPITFKPRAGDMIIFPSNPYFSHEVKPVTSGYRVTLVQWHNALVN